MSRRNRSGSGNTYVNNVRGPTSALTSFLNERGIRRANPAPAPQAAPPPATQADQPQQEEAEEDQPATASSSSSRPTRTTRLTRGRSITSSTAAASSSRDAAGAEDEDDESDDDSDDEDSDDDVVPVTLSVRSTRTTRVQASSSKSAASTSKVAAAKAKAKAAAAAGEGAGPSKKRRKRDSSDDSNDEDFHDITGYVSRSRFSHKGRMPQGSNKIEFCSRCRARFTVKAGSTPAVDEDSGGLLCPTCSGTSDASSAAPKPAKRVRRQQQKAEIENKVPSLQDLCIQVCASDLHFYKSHRASR